MLWVELKIHNHVWFKLVINGVKQGSAGFLFSGVITMSTCLKDFLVLGSLRSKSKLVDISLVIADAKPAFKAACQVMQDANLVLLFMDVTELMVGTSCIFVPSGNLLEVELYQTFNLSLTSCSLSTAHSICRALTFSSDDVRSFWLILAAVALIGFHLTPTFSSINSERSWERRSLSCALVEYSSHPTSVAFSLSEALGQRGWSHCSLESI